MVCVSNRFDLLTDKLGGGLVRCGILPSAFRLKGYNPSFFDSLCDFKGVQNRPYNIGVGFSIRISCGFKKCLCSHFVEIKRPMH